MKDIVTANLEDKVWNEYLERVLQMLQGKETLFLEEWSILEKAAFLIVQRREPSRCGCSKDNDLERFCYFLKELAESRSINNERGCSEGEGGSRALDRK